MAEAALPAALDPARIAVPGFRYWFRYPLHALDFHPVHADARDPRSRLLGYYAATRLACEPPQKRGRR